MDQGRSEDIGDVSFPRRGNVYDVDLDPVVDHEIGKRRPAIIVSNDQNNQYAETITVIPLTGQPEHKVYPFEVVIPEGVGGLTTRSRAKCNQIRTPTRDGLLNFEEHCRLNRLANSVKQLRCI